MYRWPIELVVNDSEAESVVAEVPARGAEFTMLWLSSFGHPIHLALIDAHLRGDVRVPLASRLGEDSQSVAASLLGPLAALYWRGVAQATLRAVRPVACDPCLRARFAIGQADRAIRLVCLPTWGEPEPGWVGAVITLPSREEVAARRGGPAAIRIQIRPLMDEDSAHAAGRTIEERERPDDLERAEAAAWAAVERALGRCIAERRKEPIAPRLSGGERSTELVVGWSLVLPRNRRLFAAWLGSDGSLHIKPAATAPVGPA